MICTNGKTVLEVASAWMDAAARCDLEAVAAGMATGCMRYGEPSWIVMDKPGYIAGYAQYLASFSDYRLEIEGIIATWTEVGKDGLVEEIRAYVPSTRGRRRRAGDL